MIAHKGFGSEGLISIENLASCYEEASTITPKSISKNCNNFATFSSTRQKLHIGHEFIENAGSRHG